jgi:fatty-acyl-CoA synthase
VHYEGATLSYAELAALSRRAARGLERLGVGAGDRVALWLPNTPAYVALWLACARLGAIAVAVNTRFRSAEVGDIVGRSAAKVLVLWPGFRAIDFLSILADIEPAALAQLETLIVYDEDDAERAVPAPVAHCRRVGYRELVGGEESGTDRSGPDVAVNIFTTSGTTSRPKFVLHGQGPVVRHARLVARHFGYDRGGALLNFLPLCGVFGFNMMTAALAAGAPMVLMSAFDAETALGLIRAHDVRHLNAPDEAIDAFLRLSPDPVALPTIGACGFAYFNASLADIAERADARGLRLIGLFGMSECQALFARQEPDEPLLQRKLGGGYLVSPEARVRVRDPETGRLLPHGQQGELEVRGPSLCQGYYGNPKATAEAFTEDGYLRTGDLGYTTAENHFIYVARMGDVLRLGGFLVSPAEIESYLQRHPMVDGAQVVGVPTAKGLRPVGFVTLRPDQGFDEAALLRHCQSGLARFKVPLRVLRVEEFPTAKSANGTKIQRVRLREMATAALAEAGARHG